MSGVLLGEKKLRSIGSVRFRPAGFRIPHTLARLARRPLLYWLMVIVLAISTLVAVSGADRRAQAVLDSYGERVEVLQVIDDVGQGELIDGHVRTQSLPAALVPDNYLVALPSGARAGSSMVPGEILLEHRLIDVTTELDQVIVAVPVSSVPPAVQVGDSVVMIALSDPLGLSDAQTVSGLVVELTDGQMMVRIGRAHLVTMIGALHHGTVGVALGL